MSSNDPTSIQEAVLAIHSLELQVCATYAATALLVYDWTLTFSTECDHIWKPKKSFVFYLFVALRYCNILYLLLECFTDFLPLTSAKSCGIVSYLAMSSCIIAKIAMHAIFTLRVYAIWNRSILVLLFVSLVAAVPVMSVITTYANTSIKAATGITRKYSTCLGHTSPLGLRIAMVNSIGGLCFDTLVVSLTIARTIRHVMSCRKLGIHKGLSFYLLRDGIFYFLAIQLWYITEIALDNIPSQLFVADITALFEISISTILLQRLLLNLREVEEEIQSPTHATEDIGQLSFAHGPVLGNVGAPLRTSEDGEEELCEESSEKEILGASGGMELSVLRINYDGV